MSDANLTVIAVLLTLIAYEAAEWLFRASRKAAVLNPLLISVVLLLPCLNMAGMSYDVYFRHAQLIHFMLGPVTVALAVPLYEQRQRVKDALLPLAVSTIGGCLIGVGLSAGVLWIAGASRELIASAACKSVTTPVAMALSQQAGGTPALTAGLALVAGVFGAVTVPGLLATLQPLLGRRSPSAMGYALGMCAHGCGSARAFQDGNEAGAFSGLAIGLNALATAIVVPCLFKLWH